MAEQPVAYQYPKPQGDPLQALGQLQTELLSAMSSFTEEAAANSYAPGKWTVKELLGHMVDSERIFSYRALCLARGEKQSLPGFEEDEYVAAARFNNRPFQELLEDYRVQRQATLRLFSSFSPEMLLQTGTANGRPVTALQVLEQICGHEAHHLKIIAERYMALAR